MSKKISFPLNKAIRILTEYSETQKRWISEKRDQISIFCKKGCDFCCNISVKISIPEALLLINCSKPEVVKELQKQAEKIRELWSNCGGDEELYFEKYRYSPGSCAFLSHEGFCTIHRFRPLPCRQTMSGLPGDYCSRDVGEKFTGKELKDAIASLKPDFFTNTPYIIPLLDMGELYEYELSLLSRVSFGFSCEGVMPVLVDLLIKSGTDISGTVPEHLSTVLGNYKEDPFLLKLS